jgi:uncharacterized protein with NAD-binding domain and iron-sulfur cluster
MRRVVVLGGGMAGLTAAWRLSDPDCREETEVTLYQRGWRLGGKGASSRGVHGRIEEHGLHVWLGYYDNAFALLREVYDELDRDRTDPGCPIRSWRDAFTQADDVGVEDQVDGSWSHWVATFRRQPGEPGDDRDSRPPSSAVATFVRRGLALLLDFAASLQVHEDARVSGGVLLSGSPVPPANSPRQAQLSRLDQLLRQAEIAALVGAVEVLQVVGPVQSAQGSMAFVLDRLDRLRRALPAKLEQDADLRRSAQLADLVLTSIRGIIRDGLLGDPRGFGALDALDFREWLRRQGAREDTCQSPLVRGMYDLVFAYEQGDPSRPRFAAGLGLFLAGKLFFDYRGSIFWHLTAGMGDVVFAPLYQALRARGVRFRFFHRLDQLHLAADHTAISTITLGRQAELVDPAAEYEPLIRVKGLPCYPAEPRAEQLRCDVAADLECHWSDRASEQSVELRAGVDFDVAVLATSLGMIRHVCPELVEDSARWRTMLAGVATVPTQALQVWMRRSESDLGWKHSGSTVSGYVAPFDTYASMSHLVQRECWPDDQGVRSLGYFCSVLTKSAENDHTAARERVRSNAVDFLDQRVGHFWPAARSAEGGFRWDLLPAEGWRSGPDRLSCQFYRANVDPSDQYVQSLPGTSADRLRADESGYRNLFLAGDWINSGLNAGCIEAAVMSGIEAANAVLGRPLMTSVLGQWWGVTRP